MGLVNPGLPANSLQVPWPIPNEHVLAMETLLRFCGNFSPAKFPPQGIGSLRPQSRTAMAKRPEIQPRGLRMPRGFDQGFRIQIGTG